MGGRQSVHLSGLQPYAGTGLEAEADDQGRNRADPELPREEPLFAGRPSGRVGAQQQRRRRFCAARSLNVDAEAGSLTYAIPVFPYSRTHIYGKLELYEDDGGYSRQPVSRG